jgi:hypothetical protein
MSAEPCDHDRPAPDHLVWRGRTYTVDDVTVVDTDDDGATLLEVWATERGGDSGVQDD